MKANRNVCRKYGPVLAGVGLVAAQSQAAGVDLSALTAGVDLSTVGPAIIAVAVIKLGPQIIKFAVNAVTRLFPRVG